MKEEQHGDNLCTSVGNLMVYSTHVLLHIECRVCGEGQIVISKTNTNQKGAAVNVDARKAHSGV